MRESSLFEIIRAVQADRNDPNLQPAATSKYIDIAQQRANRAIAEGIYGDHETVEDFSSVQLGRFAAFGVIELIEAAEPYLDHNSGPLIDEYLETGEAYAGAIAEHLNEGRPLSHRQERKRAQEWFGLWLDHRNATDRLGDERVDRARQVSVS